MPLEKKRLTFPMTAGMDQGTAPEHVQGPSLLSVKNGVFDKAGAINKRNGISIQALTTTDWAATVREGGSLFDANGQIGMIARASKAAETLFDGYHALVASGGTAKIVDGDVCVPVTATVKQLSQVCKSPFNFQMTKIVNTGTTYYAIAYNIYIAGALTAVFKLVDSNYVEVNSENVSGAVVLGVLDIQYGCFVYHDSGYITIKLLSSTDAATAFPAGVAIQASAAYTDIALCKAGGGTSIMLATINSDNDLVLTERSVSGLSIRTLVLSAAGNRNMKIIGREIHRTPSSSSTPTAVSIPCSERTLTTYGYWKVDSTFGSPFSSVGFTLVDNYPGSPGPYPVNIQIANDVASDAGTSLTILIVDMEETATNKNGKVLILDDYPAPTLRLTLFDRRCQHAYGNYDGKLYLLTSTDHVLDIGTQRTYFLSYFGKDSSGAYVEHVVCKFMQSAAYKDPAQSANSVYCSPMKNLYVSSKTLETILAKEISISEHVGISGYRSEVVFYLAKTTLNAKINSAQLEGKTYFGGGLIRQWDGTLMADVGFQEYPWSTLVTQAAATSATWISPGAAAVIALKSIFKWVDAKGDLYRSAPSQLDTITTAGTATYGDKLTSTVRSLRVGTRGKMLDTFVHTYRTKAAGTKFYQTNQAAGGEGYILNAPYSATVATICDQQTDTQIEDNDPLYTDSGELEAIAPPAGNILCAHGGRIFLIPFDDPSTIWYSKQKAKGYGLEFNDALVHVSNGVGDITGLASLDGKLIIFREKSISYIYGDGPNALGVGIFSEEIDLTREIGAVNHESIAVTDQGVFFKSHRGIYLMDKGLNVSYVGSQVEDYNACSVVRAVAMRNVPEVRFLLSDYTILVYNTQQQAWSFFVYANDTTPSTFYPVDIADIGGVFHVLSSLGVVCKDNSTYQDIGPTIKQIVTYIKTPWYKADIENDWRVYRAHFLGYFAGTGAAQIIVKVYVDYVETATETITLNLATITAGYTFGLRIKPKIQKCRAMRFDIYDPSVSGVTPIPYGNYLQKLSGVALTVGVKGASKLSGAKSP